MSSGVLTKAPGSNSVGLNGPKAGAVLTGRWALIRLELPLGPQDSLCSAHGLTQGGPTPLNKVPLAYLTARTPEGQGAAPVLAEAAEWEAASEPACPGGSSENWKQS